jgi:disulfide bond formation protein DsbB
MGELQGDNRHQLWRRSALLAIFKRNVILNVLMNWLDHAPRRIYVAIALVCVAMLGFGQYLQHGLGIVPCPMCIVQRYAMFLVAISAALAGATDKKGFQIGAGVVAVLFALGGAYVAARQSWLQWYPPEVASCGRDLYGMIETFPLQRVIPMIFKGSGDCSAVDWSFLGGTIANWSFLSFCGFAAVALLLVWRRRRTH